MKDQTPQSTNLFGEPINQPAHEFSNKSNKGQDSAMSPQVHGSWYNSHKVSEVRCMVYENELMIEPIYQSQHKNPPPKRRKKDITRFSTKSRIRILHKFNRLQTKVLSPAIFITLTAPHGKIKPELFQDKFLKSFLPSLKNIIPNLVYAWRLEPHRDGFPHYHMFAWSWDIERNLASRYYKDQIRDAWSECFDLWDRDFRRHGMEIKRVTSHRKAMSYVSKYMAKEDEGKALSIQGRRWGNSSDLPCVPITEFDLTGDQHDQLIRAVKRLLKSKGGRSAELADGIRPDNHNFLWTDLSEIMMLLQGIAPDEIISEITSYSDPP